MPHYMIEEIVWRTGDTTGKHIPVYARNPMHALRFAHKMAKLKDSPTTLDASKMMVFPHGERGRFAWVAREIVERPKAGLYDI